MYIVGAGDTSVTLYIKLRDSSTGAAKTGLLFNSAGVAASYVRPKAAPVDIVLVTQTVTGAWTSGGFVEIDNAKCPGLYRVDVPDGAFAVGVGYTLVNITFSNVLAESLEVILDPMPDVISGLIQTDSGNTVSTFKTSLTSAVDNFHKDAWILFRSGNLAGLARQISGYTGASKFITVGDPCPSIPLNNDAFVIVNR